MIHILRTSSFLFIIIKYEVMATNYYAKLLCHLTADKERRLTVDVRYFVAWCGFSLSPLCLIMGTLVIKYLLPSTRPIM